jgi:hypothetical protein
VSFLDRLGLSPGPYDRKGGCATFDQAFSPGQRRMPKDPSPLLGYNNNIRHKSRVFHVQTEDSGVRHPHIITHLFMDGGRILKSVKTSYAEHLGVDKMADVVRQMMKEQHKAMLMALRDGQYDELVEGGGSNDARKAAVATAPTELALKATPAAQKRAASVRPPPVIATVAASDLQEEEGPQTSRNPSPPEELTLDIDALERAAAESSSPIFQQNDLPPPPANLFRERGGGGYSTVVKPEKAAPPAKAPASVRRGASSRPPPAVQRRGATPRPPPPSTGKTPSRPVRPRSAPPTSGPVSEGRYAPARPAAIFGHSKPPRGASIFGEDLISDKSLDEVILSYLAEDLEVPSEKKKK